MFEELDSAEKNALNNVLAAARKIYDTQKLKETITFEKWLQDIAQEMLTVIDRVEQSK